ncbi:hypothetical protein Ae717Ps2_6052c [Pseudonocardia sp. Ae717_Ps2]|uniref:hypothetical protein n=1 Tax=Pseudonocardia sp. Ae717_Ps2 TaxID=1885573 RepID=UPI00094B5416|nr:hypothetical protein [Pseudonocardia sp. Ae717_Ps2]OLM27946.1 hypothetical protein Ae717Ps2_6913 [Pseudonocardia sp. Ae717_Ps2]OLM27962.1 hypothetical protein Ae717Ps2_6929 [Pseudonocardia sp. Ae717_Ps2]OLM28030.1 hypothetical protein Ae717Ps2_6880c [Pseudonocardia sp. Ae717_Ps2]OLM28041.1 hypothetical protein Ae717Ps2_6891c [Pseudonocardia sp. Ae717_Ps2]OLM28827.1 hypothetical protein Ae717Ps2_5946c [Pseudonocardia sp. Ae717_Ps2]
MAGRRWPVLDGQMGLVLVVLTCTSCQHAEEIPDDGGRLPDQCPRCDGWAFTGALVSTTSTAVAS